MRSISHHLISTRDDTERRISCAPDRRAVTICGEPVPTVDGHHGCQELAAGRKAGGWCLASSAWRFEQSGDLGNGFGTWADVPHRGARVAVPGLGHDQLQRDTLLAEMGGCRVAQLVQLPPGVPG